MHWIASETFAENEQICFFKLLIPICVICIIAFNEDPALDRSQSVFYIVPQERQTDTVTPLSRGVH